MVTELRAVSYKKDGTKAREGDPHINLCLAVLAEAKKTNSKMWQDFQKEHRKSQHHNPFEVALWVGSWWQKEAMTGLSKLGKPCNQNPGEVENGTASTG